MSDIPAAPVDPTAPTAPVTGKRSRETTPEDELPVRRTKPLGAPPRAMEVAELFDADAPFDTVAPLLLGSWFAPFMVPAAPDEHDELRGTLGWGVATAILADQSGIQANRHGVTNMDVTVRLRRETGDDARVFTGGQICLNDFLDKILGYAF